MSQYNHAYKYSQINTLKLVLLFLSDIYSSHTSSSFSPSISDGAATPNSLIQDRESKRINSDIIEENGNERSVKKSKLSELCGKSVDKSNEGKAVNDGKIRGVESDAKGVGSGNGVSGKGGKQNGKGTYQCQFCDKSFPRLGYLKKHEQVRVFFLLKENILSTF